MEPFSSSDITPVIHNEIIILQISQIIPQSLGGSEINKDSDHQEEDREGF